MRRNAARIFTVLFAVLFLSLTVLEMNAHARAGGGRSMGGRGMRSYSRQVTPAPQQSMPRQPYAPVPYQQRGGGFMSGIAGGMMGGMLGSMLFSGNAQAGGQAPAGGIGLFEIILLAGGGYFIYRAMSRRRE